MSSKSRSIRRAATRAKDPKNERKGMSLPEVLTSLSQRIHDQGRLIEELEKVVEEHEKKLAELLGAKK